VSWFNGEKGFGFVKLSDGSGDAFLHAKVLEGAGHNSVDPGATLVVRVGQGQKGMQVTQVVSVDNSTATPAAARPARPAGPRMGGGGGPRMDGPTTDGVGTVKWYDPTKGFGFITLDGGTKDAFVHATALERSGLTALAEGQRVSVQVAQGQKGPEVRSLKLA
jgi:CspA family cold shock protein